MFGHVFPRDRNGIEPNLSLSNRSGMTMYSAPVLNELVFLMEGTNWTPTAIWRGLVSALPFLIYPMHKARKPLNSGTYACYR